MPKPLGKRSASGDAGTPSLRGSKYSRREVLPIGSGGFERIDRDSVFGDSLLERHREASLAALEDAGIPARKILDEAPGGSALRDHVINGMGHEPDSQLGLAARICELCVRISTMPSLGAPASMLLGDAYRLGTLVILARAYGIDGDLMQAFSEKGRAARVKYSAEQKKAWQEAAAELGSLTIRSKTSHLLKKFKLPESAYETVRASISAKETKRPPRRTKNG